MEETRTLKVGDKAMVIEWGQCYSTFPRWAEEHGLKNYKHAKSAPMEVPGIIVAIGPHGSEDNTTVVGINIDGQDYIYGLKGVKSLGPTEHFEEDLFNV